MSSVSGCPFRAHPNQANLRQPRPCPPLQSLDEKRSLVGKKVLVRIDGGWFVGTVISAAVAAAAKKKVPKATHVVEFKRPEVPKDMVGKEPTDLSTSSYGATEAWLLLEPASCRRELRTER